MTKLKGKGFPSFWDASPALPSRGSSSPRPGAAGFSSGMAVVDEAMLTFCELRVLRRKGVDEVGGLLPELDMDRTSKRTDEGQMQYRLPYAILPPSFGRRRGSEHELSSLGLRMHENSLIPLRVTGLRLVRPVDA